jgi:hypothetical protein
MVGSARRSTPGVSVGIANRLTPSSPVLPSRRAATTSRSAPSPSSTKRQAPRIANSPPCRRAVGRAVAAIPAAPGAPLGPVQASVASVRPSAIAGRNSRFCSSLPALSRALPARHTLEKKGAHSSTRPISSISAVSSTAPRPRPSYASGIATAGQPSSLAMRFHTSGS